MRILFFMLFSFCLIVFVGCGNKKQDSGGRESLSTEDKKVGDNREKVQIINLSGTSKCQYEFRLSDIASEVSYIPLETNDSCLIGRNFGHPQLTKDYIFLAQGGIVFQYSSQGDFIRKVNKGGQGPGECSVRDFGLNEEKQLIYILDNWKLDIYIFNFQGEHVKTLKDPFRGSEISPAHMFVDKSGTIYFSFSNEDGGMKYKYAVVSDSGNVVFKSPNYDNAKIDKYIHDNIFPSIPFSEYNNAVYYMYSFNDTVFKINADYSCSPVYICQFPNRITLEESLKFGAHMLQSSYFERKVSFYEVKEDKRYLYIYYGLNSYDRASTNYWARYDKETQSLQENISRLIANDLDGGIDVRLYGECQRESSIVVLLQPFKMKEELQNSKFDKKEAKYPNRKADLEILVNKLKEDDNPVLMIIKLK